MCGEGAIICRQAKTINKIAMASCSKSLTVLFNTYPVAFDCPGGGEVQLLKYMEALENLGVNVLRYDPWKPAPQFDAADIVHFFSVQGGSSRFPVHVKYARKMPLVLSPIVWIDDPAKYSMGEIGYMLGLADRILPNSKAECEQLAGMFNLAPGLFTPIVNGVDDIFFEPVSPCLFREHFGIKESFALCMGNIEARKNQLGLIEAMRGSGIHLVLAGQEREADYAASCRDMADGTVHFIGKLEHGSELQRSAYAAASALVLPSTLETPGLAALEAGACGCSLALTEVGCTREYFGEYAEYLNPHDADSIRNTVVDAMKKQRNPALASNVREHFTWHVAAGQLVRVYAAVLEGRSAG